MRIDDALRVLVNKFAIAGEHVPAGRPLCADDGQEELVQRDLELQCTAYGLLGRSDPAYAEVSSRAVRNRDHNHQGQNVQGTSQASVHDHQRVRCIHKLTEMLRHAQTSRYTACKSVGLRLSLVGKASVVCRELFLCKLCKASVALCWTLSRIRSRSCARHTCNFDASTCTGRPPSPSLTAERE